MSLVAEQGGTFRPTRTQHELLRAALLRKRAEVLEALANWQRLVHLHDVDHGSARMLPMLYRNLRDLGIDDPLLPQLKGVYRQTWFKNQLLQSRGLDAVRALRGAGIDVMLLKGPALTATVYRESGLRPMNDFDLLVHRGDFLRAIEVLGEAGWRTDTPFADLAAHAAFQHAIPLVRSDGGEVDLHWCAVWGLLDPRGEAEFWKASRTVALGNQQVRVLCDADQLLQTCAHAATASAEVPPIRWVADAVLLLRASGEDFDWERLVWIANLRRSSWIVFLCLSYLRDGLGEPVPSWVLRRLRASVRNSEFRALALRSATDRKQKVYVAEVWRRMIVMDGWSRVPFRAAMFGRFLRSSIQARRAPEDGGSSLRTVIRLGRMLRGSSA